MFTVCTGRAQHEDRDKNCQQIIENQDLTGVKCKDIN